MPIRQGMALWAKDSAERFRERARGAAHGFADKLLALILSPWRIFKLVCFSVGLLVMGASLTSGILVWKFLGSLPDLEKVRFADVEALAKRRVAEHLVDKRAYYRWVALKDVNRPFLYSVVLSEDATFFEHEGFNFDAIADSLAENIRERKTAFGGSTISQQVVKNLYLEQEKTLWRKLKEFLITRRLESRFSKNEILEIYFNIAEFGPDIYGIGAASRAYFGKIPADVNAAEGAFLALMLPSPRRNYYSIYENKNLSKPKRKRLERVLRDMLYEDLITEQDYRRFVTYDYFFQAKKPGRLPARR